MFQANSSVSWTARGSPRDRMERGRVKRGEGLIWRDRNGSAKMWSLMWALSLEPRPSILLQRWEVRRRSGKRWRWKGSWRTEQREQRVSDSPSVQLIDSGKPEHSDNGVTVFLFLLAELWAVDELYDLMWRNAFFFFFCFIHEPSLDLLTMWTKSKFDKFDIWQIWNTAGK